MLGFVMKLLVRLCPTALGLAIIVPANAQLNPVASAQNIFYRLNGQDSSVLVACTDCGYNPGFGGYCDHRTALGHGYFHAHYPNFFPIQKSSTELVTAAEVRAFWDNDLGPDYVFVSNADTTKNCHGFTTSNNFWIESFAGVKIILDDEYVTDTLENGARLAFQEFGGLGVDHSFKIAATCPDPGCSSLYYITETIEKWNSSPVYRRPYACASKVTFSTLQTAGSEWRLKRKK